MRVKRKNRILAICLAACTVLMAACYGYPRAQAAGRVDTGRRGSLTLSLGAEDPELVQDMAHIEEPIRVHAWKLADVLETGRYEFREGFTGLSLEGEGWKELAEAAMAAIYEVDGEGRPSGGPKVPPACTESFRVSEDGAVTGAEGLSDLDLGLYLIVVEAAESSGSRYSFTPVVVSLPWSERQYLGGGASDEWEYSREVTLKPAREPRYGKVRIVKTLTSHNASQGDVTSVFEVVARESEAEDAEIVYSNVVSLTFSGTGTREAVLEHIPAGSVVTVTEVYSGANCQVTVSDGGPKEVAADSLEGGTGPTTFRFENEYDGDAKSGYGIENRFRYDTERKAYEWTTDRPGIGMEPGDGIGPGEPEGGSADSGSTGPVDTGSGLAGGSDAVPGEADGDGSGPAAGEGIEG